MHSIFHIHSCEVFMQDNAPCHKSKKVTNFLQQQKIRVLDWHGNSPNLNPIDKKLLAKNEEHHETKENTKLKDPKT